MPRVSVIIPAYNSAAYLGEAVRSVQQQTYDDWEAIVVDDASGDDTFAVAASFGGRVRAVRGERNRGPAGARNLALEHASGELIALLDADDAWLPSYLERQVQRLDTERARGRRVGIVACNARVSGSHQRTFLDHFRGPLEPVTLERVLRGNPIFISALVLRQAGEEAGWFAEELFGTEDHDLWIRILELGYEAVLNHEVLAVYRQPSRVDLLGPHSDGLGQPAHVPARAGAGQAHSRSAADRALATALQPRDGGGRRRTVRRRPQAGGACPAHAAARRGDPSSFVAAVASGSRGAMSSTNADVTVVVTCFNYGQYLAEAVDSALAQDGGAPVVIVVDDGSTDPATHRALQALPPEVEVIRQANAGLSAARNAGLHRARTRYLIVLDADDRLPPGALAALREPLDGVPDARAGGRLGFTYGRMRYFGDWEAEIPLPAYDPFKLLYRHTIGSTCLMRREVFEDVGGFDPAFPAFEDWDFWLSALEHGWHGLQIPADHLRVPPPRRLDAHGRAKALPAPLPPPAPQAPRPVRALERARGADRPGAGRAGALPLVLGVATRAGARRSRHLRRLLPADQASPMSADISATIRSRPNASRTRS